MEDMHEQIKLRTARAKERIISEYGTAKGEYGSNLFVSHHLDEIEAAYWQKHCGTTSPKPEIILDTLILKSHWGDEDDNGIEHFDFTLPENITDYVISVFFNDAGEIEEISMES